MCLFSGFARAQEVPKRGIFVSVIQDVPVFSSRKEIDKLIDFSKKAQIKILFVQIYRANKAWFPSKVADSQPYRTCLRDLSEDPFKLLIKKAHSQGIEVHAWLNLLSLGNNKESLLIKKYGPSVLTKNLMEKKNIEDYKIDDQYFLEPGDYRVRRDLSIMVGEILIEYPDLDGIQFDYIRYPDVKPSYGYTKTNIEHFMKATGQKSIDDNSLIWKDWKRSQVTGLLVELVKKVRSIRPAIQVSTTGCAPFVRAYDEAFQDWPSWINQHIVDFVTIMSYPPDVLGFEKFLIDAKKRTSTFRKVNIAVGAYKKEHSINVFAEDFKFCEHANAGACVIFHYGSLLKKPVLADYLINPQEKKMDSKH